MAYVPLQPGTLNAAIQPAASQVFTSAPILNVAGTAVDLSAWVSLTAKLVPTSASPTNADVSFGTVTATSLGVITLQTSDSDLAAASPGTARLIITGKPTSGDIVQLLAQGVATIQTS